MENDNRRAEIDSFSIKKTIGRRPVAFGLTFFLGDAQCDGPFSRCHPSAVPAPSAGSGAVPDRLASGSRPFRRTVIKRLPPHPEVRREPPRRRAPARRATPGALLRGLRYAPAPQDEGVDGSPRHGKRSSPVTQRHRERLWRHPDGPRSTALRSPTARTAASRAHASGDPFTSDGAADGRRSGRPAHGF